MSVFYYCRTVIYNLRVDQRYFNREQFLNQYTGRDRMFYEKVRLNLGCEGHNNFSSVLKWYCSFSIEAAKQRYMSYKLFGQLHAHDYENVISVISNYRQIIYRWVSKWHTHDLVKYKYDYENSIPVIWLTREHIF